jgi:Spy/CpxP family protein refolding chaperone
MDNTKTRSEAAILILVVFVLGVLLGAVGNHLWGERVWGHAFPPGPPSHGQIVGDLTRELQLTPAQQQQLSAIVDDTRAKIHAAYAPADAQREQLREQGRARIRAILTPEQLPKFEAFMNRIDEQHKKEAEQHQKEAEQHQSH